MTVSTDRSGYCSGEAIHINVDVENHSKRIIVEIRPSLKQTIVFYGNPEWHGLFRSLVLSRLSSKTYKTDKIIKTITTPADAQTMLLPVLLTVPTTTSSTCSSIQVFYMLDVILVIRNALDLHVEFPIVIGTIPFRGPNINANPALSHPHFNKPAQESSNLNLLNKCTLDLMRTLKEICTTLHCMAMLMLLLIEDCITLFYKYMLCYIIKNFKNCGNV